MIPDNGQHNAVFHRPHGDGTHWVDTQPVIAWSDSGEALVLHNNCLEIACNLPHFKRIDEGDAPVVGIAPGGGWRIERRYGSGLLRDQPVIGWAVRADGSAFPIETDADGFVRHPLDGELTSDYVIYHPSETPQTHRLSNRDVQPGDEPKNGATQ